MRYFWTRYLLSYHVALVYMLQTTDYKAGAYLSWLHRTHDFRTVMHRQTLDKTAKAKMLLLFLRIAAFLLLAIVVGLFITTAYEGNTMLVLIAGILVLLYPFILAYGIIVLLRVGYVGVQRPKEKAIISKAKRVLDEHPAKHRIAIVGSYGKTTAKEMLKTVLGESFNVAATPGNMNTDIGISRFAMTLTGQEEVLVFEFGEESKGDVARLAELTRPTIAILTGASSAHLESFGNIETVVATLREIEATVPEENIYVNADSPLFKNVGATDRRFTKNGMESWTVSNVLTSIDGMSFNLRHKKDTLKIATKLIGEHLVGVSVAVAALGHRLGMKPNAIEAGFKKVEPFEHRMQPYTIHGAYIIDDTYNGNSEGMKAGLSLLKNVKTTGRRIYVTPGLVEQGDIAQEVHQMIGQHIADSADTVVLMNNSVTDYIIEGMKHKNFTGELVRIDDPLGFYRNLDQFVLEGDVVLMQNDWTDNYA